MVAALPGIALHLSLPWAWQVREIALYQMPGDTTIHVQYLWWNLNRLESGDITLARAQDGANVLDHNAVFSEYLGLYSISGKLHSATRADGTYFVGGYYSSDRKEPAQYGQGRPPEARALHSASDDPHCAVLAAHYRMNPGVRGTGRIAGYRVLHYDSDGQTLSFAPGLNCTVLKATVLERGRFGIPVEAGTWEVTSVVRGQPDPRLFVAP